MQAPATTATPDAGAPLVDHGLTEARLPNAQRSEKQPADGFPFDEHLIDLEFDLPPDQAGRVFRHRAVSAHRRGRTRTRPAAITWHDLPVGATAPAGTLLAHGEAGWTLRRTVRRDGWPVGVETVGAAMPDPQQPRALAALRGQTRCVELAPDGDGAPLVAVSLLQGSLRNVSDERAWCRVRVHGDRAPAARLALLLGETLPLLPCAMSLDELAGAMAQGSVTGAAPPDPAAASVPADGDVDAALSAVFGTLSAALLFWIDRVVEEGGGASISGRAVHGARVAARRLRAALTVFREPLGGSLDGLRAPLAALGRTLGRLRDWDVLVDGTGAAMTAAFAGNPAALARMNALLADAERFRGAARAEVGRALARPAMRRLLLHLSLLSALRPWREMAVWEGTATEAGGRGESIRVVAPRLLDRRFRRLTAAGKHLDRLDGAALHDVRKRAKTLRYTVEFLATLLPRGDTRRLLKRLALLQDQLGTLNDTAAAAALIGQVARRGGPHEWASGLVAGWLAARAADARAALDETWREVRRTGRFWRG